VPFPARMWSRPSTPCLHKCSPKAPTSVRERASQTATVLAESMGFAVQAAGGLHNARYLEPLAGLNIYLGYGAGLGTAIAPAWIARG
jgi:hypothetical protein